MKALRRLLDEHAVVGWLQPEPVLATLGKAFGLRGQSRARTKYAWTES